MIPQIRDLAVPPQPAQHLGAGAACQCVSESAHRAHACGHPPPHGDTLTATEKTKENFPCWRQKTRLWCLGGMLHVAGCIPSWNADLGGEQGDSTDTTHIPVHFPEIQRVQGSTCPQDTDLGCGSAQEAEASCRCYWLLPAAGIFWEHGGGCSAPGAGGMPAALADESCPLAAGRAKLGNRGGLSPDKTAPN